MTRFNSVLATLAVLTSATTVRAQTTFPETEPNSTKAESSVVGCMAANDVITGTTTGGVTGVGQAGVDTVDYFRLSTCALPLAIYRHTLTLTTTTPGHTGSMRGLSQGGTVGTGGTPNVGTDVAIQNLTGTQHHWYAFGKSESLIIRVIGTPSTTAPYVHTLSTSPVTATLLGPFAAGSITITTEGQGHTTDTEVWLYDANLTAIPSGGNDDTYLDILGNESTLVRTLGAGTYYLALGTYNFKNDQASPADDNYVNGPLMEFPDAAAEDSGADPGDVAFAITDAVGTTPVAAMKTVWYEILWYKFDLIAPPAGVAYCDPGTAGVLACPCGNAPGGSNRGCDNSLGTGGASISGTGAPSLAADTLVIGASGIGSTTGSCAGSTTALTWILLQGDSTAAAGLGFNDGVRCFTGALKRIESGVSVGGVSASTSSISAQSAALGDPIAASTSRYYGVWYRDPCGTFACAAPVNSNVSNSYSILWTP